jgi:hypothetical protein
MCSINVMGREYYLIITAGCCVNASFLKMVSGQSATFGEKTAIKRSGNLSKHSGGKGFRLVTTF